MTSKKKNILNEPSEVYQPTPKVELTSEELHPDLVKLIEKSKQDAIDGKGISHEEMKKRIKLKYPFLK